MTFVRVVAGKNVRFCGVERDLLTAKALRREDLGAKIVRISVNDSFAVTAVGWLIGRVEKARYEELSAIILDSCITVHKIMGPGLLESVYQFCLVKELELRGLFVESNVPVPLVYKGFELDKEYVMDVLVEKELTIELKAAETIIPIYEAQLISYLKLADKRMGFLVNFNVPLLKQGFRRFVNGY